MRARVDYRPRIAEHHSLRERLIMVAVSVLFFAPAWLLLRVGGWFQVAGYLFGVWGVVGLARGVRELLIASRPDRGNGRPSG